VMSEISISPDLIVEGNGDSEFRFVHRKLDDSDIYFVSNGTALDRTVLASFRVNGKKPEMWRADEGTITPLSYRMEGGRTRVTLNLEPHGAIFVVFRESATSPEQELPGCSERVLTTWNNSWDALFVQNPDQQRQVCFDQLVSWTDLSDPFVKYFSGTATYSKSTLIAQEWLDRGARVYLDLGTVKNLAEVLINEKSIGVLWKAPFRCDITDNLRAGENHIEIKVTNLWPNRLIGDKQPGARQVAFASFDPFSACSPLLPSGLLGPVRLLKIDTA